MSFVKCITTFANTVIPRSKFIDNTSKPYWTKEVTEALAQERGRDGPVDHRSYFNYKRVKRHFRKRQSLAFEHYYNKIRNSWSYTDIDNAAGCDTRLFWNLIGRQRPWQKKDVPRNCIWGYNGEYSRHFIKSVRNIFCGYIQPSK